MGKQFLLKLFLLLSGKDNKSKVQFNRSVAVFHFSPDQTFTADENSRESLDSSTFDSSLVGDFSENSQRFVSHSDRIEKIMKKVSKIDAKIKRNYSDGCRLDLQNNDYKTYDLKNWQLDDPTENELEDDWSTPIGRTGNESESGLADSPIVTDVYSREDEVSWESDGDENDVGHERDEDADSNSPLRNNFSSKSSCQKVQTKADSYPTRSEVAKSTSVDLEEENAPISHPTAKTETDARSGRISVSSEIERMSSCPLLRPSANTTLKYSADVDKLKRQSFEKEVLSRGKIKDAKLQAKIEGKVRPYSMLWLNLGCKCC